LSKYDGEKYVWNDRGLIAGSDGSTVCGALDVWVDKRDSESYSTQLVDGLTVCLGGVKDGAVFTPWNGIPTIDYLPFKRGLGTRVFGSNAQLTYTTINTLDDIVDVLRTDYNSYTIPIASLANMTKHGDDAALELLASRITTGGKPSDYLILADDPTTRAYKALDAVGKWYLCKAPFVYPSMSPTPSYTPSPTRTPTKT